MTAKQRYDYLRSTRDDFLSDAIEASRLTLPYLIKQDDDNSSHKNTRTPWQAVGAKGVVTLASKLMLALVPVQSTFFKLQINESEVQTGTIDPTVRSELDLSLSKMERTIMDSIAASDDRVSIHQAMKHLVVSGNALIFMGKDNLKMYPLSRYVLDRDGMGNVIEIITKERIAKQLVYESLSPKQVEQLSPNEPNNPDDNNIIRDECDVYTHVKREGKRHVWHQEVYGKIIPGSQGTAPIDTTPWLPLRFNTVDNEAYGRGRVEEFLGDLKSLEALSQALVEGSAAAAKVVFTVSPSSTTKPATLAAAGNGAIVQGRPDDIGVVQVGKTADFSTAYQMAMTLEKRLAEAFLIMQVRDSERTTAEEVRMTQMELEAQLGGLFSMLTVEFLVPYLNRKLNVAQKSGDIPKLPKGMIKPTIVAGVNALGRGQDRQSLIEFMTTIANTLGPEAMLTYVNPDEVLKRLAASQGIDVLNLIKSQEELQAEQQQAQQQQAQQQLVGQAAQLERNQMEMMNAGADTQAPAPPPQG